MFSVTIGGIIRQDKSVATLRRDLQRDDVSEKSGAP